MGTKIDKMWEDLCTQEPLLSKDPQFAFNRGVTACTAMMAVYVKDLHATAVKDVKDLGVKSAIGSLTAEKLRAIERFTAHLLEQIDGRDGQDAGRGDLRETDTKLGGRDRNDRHINRSANGDSHDSTGSSSGSGADNGDMEVYDKPY